MSEALFYAFLSLYVVLLYYSASKGVGALDGLYNAMTGVVLVISALFFLGIPVPAEVPGFVHFLTSATVLGTLAGWLLPPLILLPVAYLCKRPGGAYILALVPGEGRGRYREYKRLRAGWVLEGLLEGRERFKSVPYGV